MEPVIIKLWLIYVSKNLYKMHKDTYPSNMFFCTKLIHRLHLRFGKERVDVEGQLVVDHVPERSRHSKRSRRSTGTESQPFLENSSENGLYIVELFAIN